MHVLSGAIIAYHILASDRRRVGCTITLQDSVADSQISQVRPFLYNARNSDSYRFLIKVRHGRLSLGYAVTLAQIFMVASDSVRVNETFVLNCDFGGTRSLPLACKSSGGLRGVGSSGRGNATGGGIIRAVSSCNALAHTEDA